MSIARNIHRALARAIILTLLFVLAFLAGATSYAQAEAPKPAAPDLRPTVAVLYFEYTGDDPKMQVLSKGLAQMLTSDLARIDGVRVVERERLQALLTEMKLNRSSKFDASTASRIGQLLGARYLVLGNYLDFMGTLQINADFVEVNTGLHASGASADGKPEEFLTLKNKISEALTKVVAIRLTSFKPDATHDTPPRSRPRHEPPAQLKLSTALGYSRALDAIDRGDSATAKTELQAVLKEQPDFAMAEADLKRPMH